MSFLGFYSITGYVVYNLTITSPEQKDSTDFILWWLLPGVIFLCFVFAWSNHFENSLHWNDIPAITDNRAVQNLHSIPRLFRSPRAFSSQPEQADYRPLLSTTFALDYALTGSAEPLVFQVHTFIWFTLLIFSLYGLFRIIPGGNHLSAVAAAGLFAIHPVAADTVNYILRRGVVMGSLGVSAGLLIWIVWPRMLPDDLWYDTRRNPENWQEDVLKKRVERLNKLYRRFIHLPLGLYLIPVAFGMLADPAAAVFAPLLAAYICVFEPERVARRILPATLVCGVYFAFESFITWHFNAASRIPWLTYWVTEPWVAMRYLCRFFMPMSLSADSGFAPLRASEWPLAAAGMAGVAALVCAAVIACRRKEWKAVSFGLWWFLLTMFPASVLPTDMAEANWRMFLPFAGLALAVTRTAWIVFGRWASAPGSGVTLIAAASAMGALLLAGCTWSTHERNRIWNSEDSLWQQVVALNPLNARGLLEYGEALILNRDFDRANDYLQKATAVAVGNASVETDLALAYDRLGNDAQADQLFQRATSSVPAYGRAWSAYSQWLMARQRQQEAFTIATRAIAIEPGDSVAYQTLMDVYSQQFDWDKLKRVASDALKIDPEDPAAQHSAVLARATLDEVVKTEERAKVAPSPDEYLKLSVLYYQNKRYEDCVNTARSALKLNPALGEAWANIAAADHAMGKDDDAIAALHEVIRLRPDMTFAAGDLQYLLNRKSGANR